VVSPLTNWRQYSAYRCSDCQENCINRYDDLRTKTELCRRCLETPDLDSQLYQRVSEIETSDSISKNRKGATGKRPPSHGGLTPERDRQEGPEGPTSYCGQESDSPTSQPFALSNGGDDDD
jgi:hypothetical protein